MFTKVQWIKAHILEKKFKYNYEYEIGFNTKLLCLHI